VSIAPERVKIPSTRSGVSSIVGWVEALTVLIEWDRPLFLSFSCLPYTQGLKRPAGTHRARIANLVNPEQRVPHFRLKTLPALGPVGRCVMIGAKTALGRQILNLEAGKSLLMRKNKPSNNHQRNNPCQGARIDTNRSAELFTQTRFIGDQSCSAERQTHRSRSSGQARTRTRNCSGNRLGSPPKALPRTSSRY
jgi:hypothetical protein